MSPSFKGTVTLKEMVEKFKDQSYTENFVTEKKRRNLVTDLLRHICQSQPTLVRAATDDQIYDTAYEYLKVGDLKSAVKHLTYYKKTKLAMLVSQSCHNGMVRQSAVQFMNTSAKKIIQLIAGTDSQVSSWEK